MRICAHEPAATRQPFGQRCAKGFLLGCSPLHHRSWRVAIDHAGIRVTDTVAWFPEDYVMPGASPAARLEAALREVSQCCKTLGVALKQGRGGHDREIISRAGLQALDELSRLYTSPAARLEVAYTGPPPAEAGHERAAVQERAAEEPQAGPRADPRGAREMQQQPALERIAGGQEQRVQPADDRQALRVTSDITSSQKEPAQERTTGEQRVPEAAAGGRREESADSSKTQGTGTPAGAAAKDARFEDTLGDVRKRKKVKARPNKKSAGAGASEGAEVRPAAAVEKAATVAKPSEQAAEQQHVFMAPPGHKHASRYDRQPQPDGRQKLQGGRGKTAKHRRGAGHKSLMLPEYIVATPDELKKYTDTASCCYQDQWIL
jgi:hypothetical protein